MRFVDLLEHETEEWPETIEGWRLANIIRDREPQHEDDFLQGDIEQNISAFGVYHLRRIPISELLRGIYTIHRDRVHDYASLSTEAPPIIVDLRHKLVIDGNHRVEAAVRRGETDILAYVGDQATYQSPDDEEH